MNILLYTLLSEGGNDGIPLNHSHSIKCKRKTFHSKFNSRTLLKHVTEYTILTQHSITPILVIINFYLLELVKTHKVPPYWWRWYFTLSKSIGQSPVHQKDF